MKVGIRGYSPVARQYATVDGDRYQIDLTLAWGYGTVAKMFESVVRRSFAKGDGTVDLLGGLVRFHVTNLGPVESIVENHAAHERGSDD